MTRKFFALALLANLALADVWMTPVKTDENGSKYITFNDRKFYLRDGEDTEETLLSNDCVVALDLRLKNDPPFKNYRQGRRICKSMIHGLPEEVWKSYVESRLGEMNEQNGRANGQLDV
ncbi:hypothetical protein SprV_0401640900 [Sparganum proliferum]